MGNLTINEATNLYESGKAVFVFVNGEGYKPITNTERSLSDSIHILGILYPQTRKEDLVDEKGFWEWKALCRAEDIGVMEYEVNTAKRTMSYISYYGREGFYKVIHHLDTGFEERTQQASTKKHYNYYCG